MSDDQPQVERFESGSVPPSVTNLRTGPPWEARGHSVETFLATARQALLEPARFFSEMRREGGLGAPLVYGLIGSTLGIIVSSIVQTSLGTLPMIGVPREVEGLIGDLALILLLIIVGPFLALVSLFVSSAISHVMLLLLGGARSFETTFRVISYAAGSTGLIAMVPFCGGIVSVIWQLVAAIIGLSRAHEVSTGKAAGAVLLPAVFCCVILIGVIVAVVALGAAAVWGALGRA